jgi:hypothetical protein
LPVVVFATEIGCRDNQDHTDKGPTLSGGCTAPPITAQAAPNQNGHTVRQRNSPTRSKRREARDKILAQAPHDAGANAKQGHEAI